MELSRRLAAVAASVPRGSVPADIGTDHGLLPISLVESKICPRAIATELNEGPFLAAKLALEQSGLQAKISLRRGDGLTPLRPGEAQVIVIAGMGGGTIRGILARSKAILDLAGRLILQPMSDAGALRLWICASGWKITDESLVEEDGRVYPVIVAEPGLEPTRDPLRLELGPRLLEKKDPLLGCYLEKIVAGYRRVLSGLARSSSDEAGQKAVLIEKKVAEIEKEVAKCR